MSMTNIKDMIRGQAYSRKRSVLRKGSVERITEYYLFLKHSLRTISVQDGEIEKSLVVSWIGQSGYNISSWCGPQTNETMHELVHAENPKTLHIGHLYQIVSGDMRFNLVSESSAIKLVNNEEDTENTDKLCVDYNESERIVLYLGIMTLDGIKFHKFLCDEKVWFLFDVNPILECFKDIS